MTALLAINVFAVGFGVTWGPVMWLMLSEPFDSERHRVDRGLPSWGVGSVGFERSEA